MDDSKDTLNNRYNLWDTRFLFGCACDLQLEFVSFGYYTSLFMTLELNAISSSSTMSVMTDRNWKHGILPFLLHQAYQLKRLIVEWHFVDDNHSFYFMFIR